LTHRWVISKVTQQLVEKKSLFYVEFIICSNFNHSFSYFNEDGNSKHYEEACCISLKKINGFDLMGEQL
jgi:hypothetical protein